MKSSSSRFEASSRSSFRVAGLVSIEESACRCGKLVLKTSYIENNLGRRFLIVEKMKEKGYATRDDKDGEPQVIEDVGVYAHAPAHVMKDDEMKKKLMKLKQKLTFERKKSQFWMIAFFMSLSVAMFCTMKCNCYCN
ncbi:hypothetical protein RIF29_24975 [Crotalaria pallida]|uniref:Uncharacterized protein n=1 Tax=Crotalaria pallida TaxID=3830 RepID=A0AAN9ESX6_CROPI